MTKNCNGVNKLSKNKVQRGEKRYKFDEHKLPFGEEFHKTEAFRGFEKLPRVLLSRYDITPYLKNGIKSPIHKIVPGDCSLTNALHLKRLVQGCYVKLVRHNLKELQSSLASSPRSDISVTDYDMDVNMANLRCKICDKMYASEKKLLNHQQNKHIIYKPITKPQKRVSFSDHIVVHEVKEYHKCRKCTKIFENYKMLKLHMKLKHKKRKCYICHYCNKNFVDRMFFKVHIKLHCDVCSLLLPNKSQYVDHRRNVCRVLKKHVCKTCDISFFRLMNLKDHSYEHLGSFFICDICKDQFETKCAVSHHIAFLHSEERPKALYDMRNLGNERLYLCNFCEESSVDKDLIEAHVQTLPDLSNRAMTGYEDYYFCDQCLRKFGTEQDMLQHKWTHFLINGENPRTRLKLIKPKKTFNVNEKLPEHMKPLLVLEKLNVTEATIKSYLDSLKPKRTLKKTLYSKHQCPNCGKYYSSNYCLHRHIETQHSDYEQLQCKVCEEMFVWPSLLKSHKCIRLNHPEMPFEDARPEIHFDNLHEIVPNGFDDFNINETEDYMNSIDFEIPGPVPDLAEGANVYAGNPTFETPLQSLGYKVVLQEVPIEF